MVHTRSEMPNKAKIFMKNLLCASDSSVMDKSIEVGKPNLHYNSSSGTLDLPYNGKFIDRHNSMPNGKLAMTNGINNGDIDLDRLHSVASTTIKSDNTSVLELVVHKSRKKTCCCASRSKLCLICTILLLLLLIAVISISTLYIMEVDKDTKLIETMKKISSSNYKPCFPRETATKIENITNEPEIIRTIHETKSGLFSAFMDGQFHAISINVNYIGENIFTYNYGTMNFFDKMSPRPTADTPYPVASVSKIFTALTLNMLANQGVIESIDDELVKYEPKFSVKNPFNNKNITFRQLACSLSGVAREAPCYPIKSKKPENLCPFGTEEMLQKIGNTSLFFPPGLQPSYSNLAFGLLGRILEKQLVNETFESFVTKHILEPLNMTNTGFDVLQRKKDFPLSSTAGDVLAEGKDWGWLNPAGGMYSSINDLTKFTNELLGIGKNKVLSKKSRIQLFNIAYIWPDTSAQGCPFEISPIDPYKDNSIEYLTYNKDAMIFGYHSVLSIIPDLKLNVNVLGASKNENASRRPLLFVLNKFLLAIDKILKRRNPAYKYKLPPNPQEFIGVYRLTTHWPFITRTCNITLKNDKLYLRLEWWQTPLSQHKNYTLKTGNFDRINSCPALGSGLAVEEFIFTAPTEIGGKCPEFYIQGISIYGYVHFIRVQ